MPFSGRIQQFPKRFQTFPNVIQIYFMRFHNGYYEMIIRHVQTDFRHDCANDVQIFHANFRNFFMIIRNVQRFFRLVQLIF